MKILFDTSIWISHLKKSNAQLTFELEQDNVLIHEAIIGELAIGNIPNRKSFISDLKKLPLIQTVNYQELLIFIEENSFYGIGLSWVDINLLASAIVSEAELITNDKILDRTWNKS